MKSKNIIHIKTYDTGDFEMFVNEIEPIVLDNSINVKILTKNGSKFRGINEDFDENELDKRVYKFIPFYDIGKGTLINLTLSKEEDNYNTHDLSGILIVKKRDHVDEERLRTVLKYLSGIYNGCLMSVTVLHIDNDTYELLDEKVAVNESELGKIVNDFKKEYNTEEVSTNE